MALIDAYHAETKISVKLLVRSRVSAFGPELTRGVGQVSSRFTVVRTTFASKPLMPAGRTRALCQISHSEGLSSIFQCIHKTTEPFYVIGRRSVRLFRFHLFASSMQPKFRLAAKGLWWVREEKKTDVPAR